MFAASSPWLESVVYRLDKEYVSAWRRLSQADIGWSHKAELVALVERHHAVREIVNIWPFVAIPPVNLDGEFALGEKAVERFQKFGFPCVQQEARHCPHYSGDADTALFCPYPSAEQPLAICQDKPNCLIAPLR
jgi:hypothetical protein